MAVITEYLTQLLAKQVEDRGLVVWYDPEGAYAEAAAELALPGSGCGRATSWTTLAVATRSRRSWLPAHAPKAAPRSSV